MDQVKPKMSRERPRDSREFDTSSLGDHHAAILHRDYSAHFWRWSFARRFVSMKDNVLEVGCGPEWPLAKILTGGIQRLVNSYVGVDLNKVKPTNSQRIAVLGEFDFVRRWRELEFDGGYDVIVHYEVIEHMKVVHGRALLKACHALLRSEGIMLMSTPCYDGVRHAANHIHEYDVDELRRYVEAAGFDVLNRFGTFMDIKHIGKELPTLPADCNLQPENLRKAVQIVKQRLEQYFDNDAISCIFAPLYPDTARNNLWVCQKKK